MDEMLELGSQDTRMEKIGRIENPADDEESTGEDP
jgi:hypothetical protein